MTPKKAVKYEPPIKLERFDHTTINDAEVVVGTEMSRRYQRGRYRFIDMYHNKEGREVINLIGPDGKFHACYPENITKVFVPRKKKS